MKQHVCAVLAAAIPALCLGQQSSSSSSTTDAATLGQAAAVAMQQASGSAGGQNQQSLFQSVTGNVTYQSNGAPASGSSTVGASVSQTSYVDFSCSLSAGSTVSAVGYSFMVNGCRESNGAVAAVNLQLCTQAQSGSYCNATDYSAAAYYPANQTSTVAGTSVGIGCNNNNLSCRLTVTSSFQVATTGAQLAQQAQTTTAAQGQRTQIAATISSQEGQSQMQDPNGVVNCYNTNNNTVNTTGMVSACSGSNPTYVGTTAATAKANADAATPATPQTNGTAGFVQAESAMGKVSGVQQGTVSAGVGQAPTIFPGTEMQCSHGMFADCCNENLQKSGGGFLGLGSCSQSEADLAAKRRANSTVSVGSYCSKHVFLVGCTQTTQTYCAFNGQLAQLVQTQGRQQLQADVANSAGATLQSQTLAFAYYAGGGGWTTALNLNGNQVAAYQEPATCQAGQPTQSSSSSLGSCPAQLGVWFGVCSNTFGCGDLPAAPYAGSQTWQMVYADPLQVTAIELNSYTQAIGACNTQTAECSYNISAWPDGQSGRAIVSQMLSFEANTAASGYSGAQQIIIGDYVVQVTPASVGQLSMGQLPASFQAGVSTNGGATFNLISLPSQLNTPLTISGTDIAVSGGCSSSTGLCQYIFLGSTEVTAKPIWGPVKTPDCSGFTTAQFAALDFSKMDLSAWTNTLAAQTPSTSSLTATATSQASTASSTGGATAANTSPSQGLLAVINPVQAMGPFTASLTVGTNWPQTYADATQNTDPIYGVSVNWGDCISGTGSSSMSRTTTSSGGSAFIAQHTYQSPATAGMCDSTGAAGPNNPRTLNEAVTLTINSASGTHTATVGIIDVYNNYVEPSTASSATSQ